MKNIYSLFGNRSHGKKLVVIAGPCVAESKKLCLQIAFRLKDIGARLHCPVIFKASFDKANRTSIGSFRGPGIKQGLEILAEVKQKYGLPVLTDIHSPDQAQSVAEVADILQIPAFLCRQTDLLVAAAHTGKPVNIKKGQFMAPGDMAHSVEKVRKSGNSKILVTERGTFFGYNHLVTDMSGLPIMRNLGVPVIFDATHSVQKPGGGKGCSAGSPEFIQTLALAAVAAGIDGIFLEVHPKPAQALSDAGCMLALSHLENLLRRILAVDKISGKY